MFSGKIRRTFHQLNRNREIQYEQYPSTRTLKFYPEHYR